MTEYYPWPHSYDPIPSSTQKGLIALGFFGILSLVTTVGLTTFIFYRLFNSKKYYSYPLRYNQSLILILNLFLADIQQALSFTLSVHWAYKQAILAPTAACTAQGWLIQMGDLSSGLFSLAIALQTFHFLVLSRHLPYRYIVVCVCSIWIFSVILSIAGPLRWGLPFFVRAGVWCWISEEHESERLFLHYIWIFICEFGTMILYAIIFWVLHKNARINAASGVQSRTLQRVARYMLTYPVAYTCLTLPLAAGRMASAAGHDLGDRFFLIAGCCMASSGWVDALLYALTRRTIVLQGETTSSGGGGTGAGGVHQLTSLYGNTTTAERGSMPAGARLDGAGSVSSSQENIVKMERVVQVTVENAPVAPGQLPGNSQNQIREQW
ncbi:integral membrane protein [Geopyxis carbonaria]|nr:integral membrane protein [Geopyxis carbonaria]